MQGNVFQTNSEQKVKTQFEDTMEALKTYASQKYIKHIELLTPLFTYLTNPKVDKPTPKLDKKIQVTLVDGTKKEIYDLDDFEREAYRCEVKNYAKECATLKTTMRSLFNVVTGQCSKMMKSKLKGEDTYKKIEEDGDVTSLLRLIRTTSRQVNTNESVYNAIDEAVGKYYRYRQVDEDNETFTRTFKSNVEVAEDLGGNIFKHPEFLKYEKAIDQAAIDARTPGAALKTEEQYYEIIREKSMAVGLVKRADQRRYKGMLTDIRDQYGYGHDVYPKTLAAAHNMIEDYTRSRRLNTRGNPKSRDKKYGKGIKGLMFNQTDLVSGTNGKLYKNVQCHGCNKWGHYVSHCPEAGQQHMHVKQEKQDKEDQDSDNEITGMSNLQIEQLELSSESSCGSDESYMFDFSHHQVGVNMMNKDYKKNLSNRKDKSSLIIDTGSTFSCVNNPQLLINIRKGDKPISGVSNGGVMKSDMEGDIPG